MFIESPNQIRKELSPRHTRVQYKKYMNQVNQTLQSLITIGKIKRNQLLSINNRALFNRGKVQRSQWMNRKDLSIRSSFLPDLNSINLDTRSPQSKQKRSSRRYHTENRTNKLDEEVIEKLIDKQMDKIKKKKNLGDKNQIVKEACQSIEEEIINKSSKNIKAKAQRKWPVRNPLAFRKVINHRRSVTDALYNQELAEVDRREKIRNKQRKNEQRFFLRRIRNITLPSK